MKKLSRDVFLFHPLGPGQKKKKLQFSPFGREGFREGKKKKKLQFFI